jgi:hypothetical protein
LEKKFISFSKLQDPNLLVYKKSGKVNMEIIDYILYYLREFFINALAFSEDYEKKFGIYLVSKYIISHLELELMIYFYS